MTPVLSSSSFLLRRSPSVLLRSTCCSTGVVVVESSHCNNKKRSFATGARGTRGHGWYHKYRQGLGGRHLQGRYWDLSLEDAEEWNNQVFGMAQTELGYLDIQVNDDAVYTLEIEMAARVLPRTCRNVELLLQAEKDGYLGTKIHHLEKGVGVCMGDVLHRNGQAGKCHESLSEHDGNTMPEECKVLWHLAGVVTMLVPSVDRVDSRFMLLTDHAPHFNGKHLPFGRVTSTSLEILRDWQANIFTQRGKPSVDMVVVKCGMGVPPPDDKNQDDDTSSNNKNQDAATQAA